MKKFKYHCSLMDNLFYYEDMEKAMIEKTDDKTKKLLKELSE